MPDPSASNPRGECRPPSPPIPANACPRRYCWWWQSLGLRWDRTPAQGCQLPFVEPIGGWHYTQLPCRRADPASPVDHYETQPDTLREDSVSPDAWIAAAHEYSRAFLEAEHAAGRFPRRPSGGGGAESE